MRAGDCHADLGVAVSQRPCLLDTRVLLELVRLDPGTCNLALLVSLGDFYPCLISCCRHSTAGWVRL